MLLPRLELGVVLFGRLDRPMTQEHLNRAEIRAALQQRGCEGIAESVWMDMEADLLADAVEGDSDHIADRFTASVSPEEEVLPEGFWEARQSIYRNWRQQYLYGSLVLRGADGQMARWFERTAAKHSNVTHAQAAVEHHQYDGAGTFPPLGGASIGVGPDVGAGFKDRVNLIWVEGFGGVHFLGRHLYAAGGVLLYPVLTDAEVEERPQVLKFFTGRLRGDRPDGFAFVPGLTLAAPAPSGERLSGDGRERCGFTLAAHESSEDAPVTADRRWLEPKTHTVLEVGVHGNGEWRPGMTWFDGSSLQFSQPRKPTGKVGCVERFADAPIGPLPEGVEGAGAEQVVQSLGPVGTGRQMAAFDLKHGSDSVTEIVTMEGGTRETQ